MRIICTYLILMGITINAFADACESHSTQPVDLEHSLKTLCIYEPTTIGWTWDSDDVSFMDFKLSLMYQLFPGNLTHILNKLHDGLGSNSALYFAFTGRLGQYIGTRDSSPVIGKRFNPKLFFRFWGESTDPSKPDHSTASYLDVGYAHESNGQSINTKAEYDIAHDQAAAFKQDPEYINDQLSRGWDDVEITLKNEKLYRTIKGIKIYSDKIFNFDLSNYIELKYFLPHGLLQGAPEDYNPAIHYDSEGQPRRRMDGVSEAVKGVAVIDGTKFKYYASIVTGYAHFGTFKTYRLEFSRMILEIPFTIWGQWGYNSDLAQYYKKASSFGFYVDLGSF